MGIDSNIERLLSLIKDGYYPTAENLELFKITTLNNNTERLILALATLLGNLAGSIPLRSVADNTEFNSIITDGFSKGLLLIDNYDDGNGNVGNAMILVIGGQKFLVPSLPI